jgi:hypothetical protein
MSNMIFSDRYCLWNDTHREVLPFLKLDTLLPPELFKEPGVSSGEELPMSSIINSGKK